MDNILARVRPILVTTVAHWTELAQALPADLMTRVPAAGQWSAVECLQHIIDTEKVFQFRLRAFQEGRDFPAFNPDSEGTRPENSSPVDMAADFTRLRTQSLQMLDQLTPADYDRQARHQELGPVTLGQMIHEWAAHDLNHTVQAERALMQPYIQNCGPWQKYFTDHIASG